MEKKLIPYTVYLPEDHYAQIKKYAKSRQASSIIRDAITSFLSGGDEFKSGRQSAMQEAIKIVSNIEEVKMLSVNGKPLAGIIADKLSKPKRR
jgi:hypothetical protein